MSINILNPGPQVSPNVYILAEPFKLKSLNRDRTIRLYLPPDYHQSDRRYPVLYMHDAQNLFDPKTSYSGEWQVDETLDHLYLSKGLSIIVVAIDHGEGKRIQEYTAWENEKLPNPEGKAFVESIVQDLKPYIDKHFRTKPSRVNTAMMGSSMGGLITHYGFFAYPEIFGKAAIFSPSYWITKNEVYDWTQLKKITQPARLYLMAGGKEGFGIVSRIRKMETLLCEKGFTRDDLYVRIVPGGRHTESFWGTWFGEAVMFLFGG